jgi:hypothetical protein
MAQDVNSTSIVFQTIKPFLTNDTIVTASIIIAIILFFIIFIVSKNKEVETTFETIITRTFSGVLMVNGLFLTLASMDITILTTLLHGTARFYVAVAGIAMMYLGYEKVFAPFKK